MSEANKPAPLFGRIAVARRLVTEEQLDECLKLQAQSEGRRLGEILVECGYMTEDEVFRVIRIQQTQMKSGFARKPGVANLSFGVNQGDEIDGYFIKKELSSNEHLARFEVVQKHDLFVLTMLSDPLTSQIGDSFHAANKCLRENVTHDSIAAIHNFGSFKDKAWSVSSYFSDDTLGSQLIREVKSESQAIDILMKLTDGLSKVHNHGVFHGSVNSKTVFMNATDPQLQQCQASPVKLWSSELQQQWDCRYRAPEQLKQNANVNFSCDIYALGVLGFEMAIGKPPFSGSSGEITEQVFNKRPASLVSPKNSFSVEFDAICAKAMAKAPEKRYLSVQEMYQDLDRLRSGEAVKAPPRRGTKRLFGWIRGLFNN